MVEISTPPPQQGTLTWFRFLHSYLGMVEISTPPPQQNTLIWFRFLHSYLGMVEISSLLPLQGILSNPKRLFPDPTLKGIPVPEPDTCQNPTFLPSQRKKFEII